MENVEMVAVVPYMRVRFGKIEQVREHLRRPWRWSTRVHIDKRNND